MHLLRIRLKQAAGVGIVPRLSITGIALVSKRNGGRMRTVSGRKKQKFLPEICGFGFAITGLMR